MIKDKKQFTRNRGYAKLFAFFDQFKIRKLLIFTFLVLIVLSLSVSSGMMFLKSINIVEDNSSSFSLALLQQTNMNINSKINALENDLSYITKNNDFLELIFAEEYTNSTKEKENKKIISNILSNITLNNEDIKKIMLIKENGDLYEDKTFYEYTEKWTTKNGFIDSSEYKQCVGLDMEESLWVTGYNNNYSEIALLKHISSDDKNGVIVMIIDQTVFGNIISEVHLGEGTQIEIINEKKQIIVHELGEKLGAEKTDGYVDYIYGDYTEASFNYGEKLITFTTIDNDWKLTCSVPLTSLLDEIYAVGRTNIIIGAIILVVVTMIIVIVTLYIDSSINYIVGLMKKVENGDLTIISNIKGKNEIAKLSNGFNIMVSDINRLIKDTKNVVQVVEENSKQILTSAKTTSDTGSQVATAMVQVSEDAMQQVTHAQSSTHIIEHLEEQINKVSESMKNVLKIVEDIDVTEKDVFVTIERLDVSSKQAFLLLETIKNDIEALQEGAEEIIQINKLIEEISNRTNLLSLNAAIEAARAGEAGLGFKVVADEISKLASESNASTQKIGELVEHVNAEIMQTISSIKDTYAIFDEQQKSVTQTNEIINQFSVKIDTISDEVQYVNNYVNDVNDSKIGVVKAMIDICTLSEESVSSSEEVTAIAQYQQQTSSDLKELSEELNDAVEKLHQVSDNFRI